MTRQITIGTRASPLALAQTEQIVTELQGAVGLPAGAVSVRKISTKGDEILDRTLAEIGGKGLFTDELNAGLRDGSIDLAVHSLKDLPTAETSGLFTAAIPVREDPRDILIVATPNGPTPGSLAELPEGARVGTASLRRKAQILQARPDLDIAPLRGNIGTRLAKLSPGKVAATVLAMAGLNRMGYTGPDWQALAPNIMLPAAGQGALAVQCRADDATLIAQLAVLDDVGTRACVTAERSFLAGLDGSCRTPIAALAILDPENAQTALLHGRLLADDGTEFVENTCRFDPADLEAAGAAGEQLAAELRARAPHLVTA
ncbi:MAG: hydroxymethylbilane synthase [Pseudomonadota bacterium]|nr:hydroxymethylbilane synthase [Pseudomonadota bacterium]